MLMKKFLTTIMIACFAASSFAQYESGDVSIQKYYGLRMGINSASLSGDDKPDMDSRTSFNLGFVMGLRISDTTPIFLESGLYYTERGAKKDKNTIGLTYLEVPILVKYGFSPTDDVHVLPYLGHTFSYGFAGKTKRPAEQYNESSYKDGFRHFDVGVKIGCGVEWSLLYLELGYQIGIANIAKDEYKTVHGNALFANFGINF